LIILKSGLLLILLFFEGLLLFLFKNNIFVLGQGWARRAIKATLIYKGTETGLRSTILETKEVVGLVNNNNTAPHAEAQGARPGCRHPQPPDITKPRPGILVLRLTPRSGGSGRRAACSTWLGLQQLSAPP